MYCLCGHIVKSYKLSMTCRIPALINRGFLCAFLYKETAFIFVLFTTQELSETSIHHLLLVYYDIDPGSTPTIHWTTLPVRCVFYPIIKIVRFTSYNRKLASLSWRSIKSGEVREFFSSLFKRPKVPM